MSDTPETDEAFRKGMNAKQVYEFAEKLERERDEAREDATNYYARIGELEKERDEARAQVENQKARIGELFSALEKLTAERDEARARVELIKPHENNPVAEFFSSSNTPETDAIYKFLRERITFEKCDTQVWMEHAQQIERERDEARNKCASWIREWRGLRDFCRQLDEDANDRLRERDEARRGIRLMAQNAELWKERADEARKALAEAWRFADQWLALADGYLKRINEIQNDIRKN